MKSLEVLLKKCPNITSIELKRPCGECDYNPVFQLITKYCNNLRQIKIWDNNISDENIKEFQRKFGPKIKSFYHLKDANNYNLFPNIENLKAESVEPGSKDFISRLELNKLKKFETILDDEEEYMIQIFVNTFPTLTHFSLRSHSEIENDIFKSLEFISNLKNLKHFGFDYIIGEQKLFCDSLKRMANKCQKLKSIECDFDISSDNSNLRQILSTFEAFPELQRLKLYLNYNSNFDLNELFSFEAFKGLLNITHLTLHLDVNSDEIEVGANILTDIDIYLPKLQYLVINGEIAALDEEVPQMADILSRLSRLQTLKLVFYECTDFDEIEVKIREKCRKIRTIDVKHFEYG